MNNIKELIKTADEIKITKKEKTKSIQTALDTLGKSTYLMLVMEEIGELIEVVSDNMLGKASYYHTAEEITDALISTEILTVIYNIKDKKIDKVKKSHAKRKKSVLFQSIKDLSKAQQDISKTVRAKDADTVKIIHAINLINETCENLIHIFKIKKKDIAKIEKLKFKRLKDRIDNGTLH